MHLISTYTIATKIGRRFTLPLFAKNKPDPNRQVQCQSGAVDSTERVPRRQALLLIKCPISGLGDGLLTPQSRRRIWNRSMRPGPASASSSEQDSWIGPAALMIRHKSVCGAGRLIRPLPVDPGCGHRQLGRGAVARHIYVKVHHRAGPGGWRSEIVLER